MKSNQLGKGYVNEIIDFFKDEKRFTYDSDIYYLKTFAKSIFMVTDFSSSMQTFAYSTLRPYIAFSNSGFDKIYQETFGDSDLRKRCGLVINSVEELKNATVSILDNIQKYKNDIKIYRKDDIFNLGKSSEYIEDNFHYIVNRLSKDDWFNTQPKE